MKKIILTLSLAATVISANAFAEQGAVPSGIPKLEHVFVVMMENHAYGQIAGNPQAPFINSLMKKANLATNYFAIAHPPGGHFIIPHPGRSQSPPVDSGGTRG